MFVNFCDHYRCQFLLPSVSSVCIHITQLTHPLHSSNSVKNYVSGIRVLHKQLDLSPSSLGSFQVPCFVTKSRHLYEDPPPVRHLPILPDPLCRLSLLTPSLGPLGPSMLVCLTFGYFAMLRQSNLAPSAPSTLTPLGTPAEANFFFSPPSLLLLVRWTKTHQSVGKSPVLPIPSVPAHPSDPVAAFHLLFRSSPTTSPNHPLLTYLKDTATWSSSP